MCRVGMRILLSLGLIGLLLSARVAPAQECSTAICVGNPCTISGTHAMTNGCDLDFGSKAVTVTGKLMSAAADGGLFSIEAGTLTVYGTLQALGGEIDVFTTGNFSTGSGAGYVGVLDVHQGGFLYVEAGGNVNLYGSDVSADGKTNEFGGDIVVFGTNINVGSTTPIHARGAGGGDGGTVSLVADNNATIAALVSVIGVGNGAAGGVIEIEGGSTGTITISKTLDASTSSTGSLDGEIDVGPACSVVISGTVRARTPELSSTGSGIDFISYSGSLNVAGSNLLADSDAAGGTLVLCRCVDANGDGACDGGCVQSPSGLGSATQKPAVSVVPIPAPPCGS
jgi:hypothetical protein